MKVIKTRDVELLLRTLDDDEDRRKVLSWFDQLENWDSDEHIRQMVKPTVDRETYALNTPDDMRIFFRLNEPKSEIVIVGLARPSRFAVTGAIVE